LKIGPEGFEPFHETDLAGVLPVDGETFVAHACCITKPLVGTGVCRAGLEPEATQLVLSHGEMERQLVVDIALDGAFAE